MTTSDDPSRDRSTTARTDSRRDAGGSWTDDPSADMESAQHIWLRAVDIATTDDTGRITMPMVAGLLEAAGLQPAGLLHAQRLGATLDEGGTQRASRQRALELIDAAITAIGTRPERNEARHH